MAMNEFGAGFNINGQDNASPAIRGVIGTLGSLKAKLGNVGAAFGALGAGAAKVGKNILDSFADALEAERQFSKGVAEVTTLIDDASMSTQDIRNVTLGMSKEFGTAGVDQTKALYQTISAGITDATDATKLLHTANKLAVGGVTDVDTAVDGLTNVLNTYSEANLEASDVSDAFFVAIKAGKTTAAELSRDIGRAAPVAESMGIAFDELLASIAAVTTKGINTSQTVSGISAAMANISKPTKDAKDEARRLGIQFTAAAVRTKGWKGFLDGITKSSKFNKDSMSKLFGSIEAVKTMTALASDDSAKFNEILGMMSKRAGATQTAFEKMAKEYDFQANRADKLREALQITFGASVKNLVTPFLRLTNALTEGFGKMVDALPPELRDIIVGVVGSIASMAVGVGGVIALVGVLQMLGVTLGGVVMTMGLFVGTMIPLALLLGGIVTGITAVYKAFQRQSAQGGGIVSTWNKIKLAFTGVYQLFKEGKLSSSMKKDLDKAENQGVLAFLLKAEKAIEKIKVFWQGLKDGFTAGLDALAPKIAQFNGYLKGVVGIFMGPKGSGPEETMEQWAGAGERAGEAVASMGGIILDVMNQAMPAIQDVAESMRDVTAEDIADGIIGLIEGFKTMMEVASDVKDVVGGILQAFKAIYRFIQVIGAGMGEGLAALINWDFDSDKFVETSKHWDLMMSARDAEMGEGEEDRLGRLSTKKYGAGLKEDVVSRLRKERDAVMAKGVQLGPVVSMGPESVFNQGGEADMMNYKLVQELSVLSANIEKLTKKPLVAKVSVDEFGAATAKAKASDEDRSMLE